MGSLRTQLASPPPPRTTDPARQQDLHQLRPEASSESLDLAVPCWASMGAHGLFSRDGPLSRRYFSQKTRSLDDFDSMHMILAKCTITPPWVNHIQPDGSLLFIEVSTPEQRHRAKSKRTASIRPQASTTRSQQKGKENRPKNNKPEGGSAKLLKKLEKRRNQKNQGQSSKRYQKNKEQSNINNTWRKHTILQEKTVCRFVKHELITRAVTAASMCFR